METLYSTIQLWVRILAPVEGAGGRERVVKRMTVYIGSLDCGISILYGALKSTKSEHLKEGLDFSGFLAKQP